MRRFELIYIVLGLVLLMPSCKKFEEADIVGGNGKIVFSFGESPDTKGVPVTSANISDVYAEGISINAFYGDKKYFKDGEYLTFKDGEWVTNKKADGYFWPNDDGRRTSFWAWAPMESNGGLSSIDLNNDEKTLSFHYEVPAGSDGQAAIAQDDVIVGAALKQEMAERLHIGFDHPLACIRFSVAKANAGTVTNITLKGLKYKGDCTYRPEPGEGEKKFTWSNITDDIINYSQNLNVPINENLNPDGIPLQEVSNDEEGTMFMIIPQEVNEAELTLTLDTGTEAPKTFKTKLTCNWEAGKSYKYALDITDGLKVTVVAESSGDTETNLVITNSGVSSSYLRAAVVGNWVNSKGEIVAPWTETLNHVSFTKAADWNTYWIYDEVEDIYYYKKHLETQETTAVKLFDSYKITPETDPDKKHDDQTLKLSVLVQIVKYDSRKALVTAAWGETAAGYLEE